MRGSSGRNIKKIFLSLLILSVLTISLYSQNQNIGGVINLYKQVVAIGPGTDNIKLNDVSGITAGDIVLLIQMKGSLIYVPENGSYGVYKESVGAAGKYEFLKVFSVNVGTKVVVFTNDILNPYDIAGSVQLVKVPFYDNNAIVTSTLTCQPWDSINKTGGILTMIVGRTLSLNANIDVTGKGFYGGAVSASASLGTCLSTPTYDNFSYPVSYTNSGFKGESQVIRAWIDASSILPIFPDYSKGKGYNLTGGGGGNGRFSGGGGGSNYGSGGKGGREMISCTPTPGDGGLGGTSIIPIDLNGGLFFGGGGGASTYESAPSATPGAKGGGIIIIICDTLKGNGKVIKAEGDMPGSTATGNAGAGGGGGGGSIALYQQSYSSLLVTSALTISANGGKGGNNAGTFGEGGGGGGGFILTNNITIPANVLKTITGGAVGTRSLGSTGGAGTAGDNRTTFSPVLNGFLFNSIRSAVTGDQVDSICSNVPFGIITGTKPIGGVPPYSIQWESSTVSDVIGFSPAAGINDQQNYSPGLLSQTTWFKRIVTDQGPPVTTDRSKAVKIIVQQAITGNNVGKDSTICYNQNPLPLVPLNAGPVNGSSLNYYLYKWVQNNTNTNWNTSSPALGTNTNPGYDPPALTSPTYYQRVVTSGRCVNYSLTVTIIVLPLITGNITARPDSVICEGSLFNNLDASAPGGGDLSYKYQWQDSITSFVWKPAAGTNAGTAYTPDTSAFSVLEKRYLRRVVFSGLDSVCKSRSVSILLTRYHKLKNNFILPDQTICSGVTPAKIIGSTPLKGNGIYTYTWQDSTKSHIWANISGAVSIDYQPPTLTDTTSYRRFVFSSACSDISTSIKINVHKPISNNIISLKSGGSDTTLCNSTTPNVLNGVVATGGTGVPGSYSYQWIDSIAGSGWQTIPVANSISYQPPVLNATTGPKTYFYKRLVSSGACINKPSAATININVLPPILNVIPTDKAVCINTSASTVVGLTLSGGDGVKYKFLWESSTTGAAPWTSVTSDTIRTSSGANLLLPLLSTPMQYHRNVWSGSYNTCSSVSNNISVSITLMPTPVFAGKDTLLNSFEFLYKLQALKPTLGSGTWSVLASSGAPKFDNDTVYNTIVMDLGPMENVLQWKVKSRDNVCVVDTTIKITILSLGVPEGISPNGDGKNDLLTINGLDFSLDNAGNPNQSIELTILNSTGAQVYSTSNINGNEWSSWDGKTTNGSELPEGTYYYLLKITSNRTNTFIKKSGFIILRRH